MLEIKVNKDGEVERLKFNGSLVEMQSSFTFAMAAVYSALINGGAKDEAEQFVSGIERFLSDKELREEIFGSYADETKNAGGVEICKVKKVSKKNLGKVTEAQLDDALKKFREIARTLGIEDDDGASG